MAYWTVTVFALKSNVNNWTPTEGQQAEKINSRAGWHQLCLSGNMTSNSGFYYASVTVLKWQFGVRLTSYSYSMSISILVGWMLPSKLTDLHTVSHSLTWPDLLLLWLIVTTFVDRSIWMLCIIYHLLHNSLAWLLIISLSHQYLICPVHQQI